jgi:hypothetical protein
MAVVVDGSRARAFRPEDAERLGVGTETPGWDLNTERRIDDGESLATGIGWFSIGLGLAEIIAPEKIAGELGMEEQKNLFRLYGFREVAKGLGILSNEKPVAWVWGRIAGDVLDLATLAAGLRKDNPKRDNVLKAISAVVGVTVVDVIAAKQLTRSRREAAEIRAGQQ